MAANEMSEEKMVHLVRNTLIAAGQEMGAEGDHWPVIKSTVQEIMNDWENVQVQRNIFAELKIHYGDIVSRMEKNLALCPDELRLEAEKLVKEARESYEACFAPMQTMALNDDELPMHIKRAGAIIKTLEGENG